MRKVAVVGAGYVGLVTGACLAQRGNFVVIIENNQEKIEKLLKGQIPFYEPALDQIVADAINKKRLIFETSIEKGLTHNPQIIFSCVGTPPLSNGDADLSFVKQVAHEIGTHLTSYILIVNKSTTPVGTTKKIQNIIKLELSKRKVDIEFDVASNPEFLKEGDAVNDFFVPDRIVFGAETENAKQLLTSLYQNFITNENQILYMNVESSELTKYASNAMLATRISFMNQLSHLADRVGADIEQVKIGMSKDKRIGPYFLNAGIGYGGSCFPKDVLAVVQMGKQHHFPMTLIKEVDNINHFQRIWFINQIIAHYGPAIANKTAGIWGLSFKPETDDIRCAPSIEVIDNLLQKKAKLIAYDPVANKNIAQHYGDKIDLAKTPHEILSKVDFLIILTEWKEFLNVTPYNFLLLKDKTIFDARNCFDPFKMHAAGLSYFCIGRNNIVQHHKEKTKQQQATP